MHLINTFILVDSIEELLVRLLNHPDLVTIVDEVAKFCEIGREYGIVWQAGRESAKHLRKGELE